jgi:hypothetical protein
MLVDVRAEDSLLTVIRKALFFPGVGGGLGLIVIVGGNPDHNVSNTVSELTFTVLMTGIVSTPFIGFALLTWHMRRSRQRVDAFAKAASDRIRGPYKTARPDPENRKRVS